MDFELSEEQRAIAETTRRFVEKEMPRHKVLQWARDKVEPTKAEQQHNREREMMGFNLGLWGMAALVVIVVVAAVLLLM